MSKHARRAEHQYLMRLARSKLPPLKPIGGPVSIGQREDRACSCCGYHVCKRRDAGMVIAEIKWTEMLRTIPNASDMETRAAAELEARMLGVEPPWKRLDARPVFNAVAAQERAYFDQRPMPQRPTVVDDTERPGWTRVHNTWNHESGHCAVTKGYTDTAHSHIDMQGERAPFKWNGMPHGSLEAAFARCESYLDNLQAANEIRAGIRPRVRSQ